MLRLPKMIRQSMELGDDRRANELAQGLVALADYLTAIKMDLKSVVRLQPDASGDLAPHSSDDVAENGQSHRILQESIFKIPNWSGR